MISYLIRHGRCRHCGATIPGHVLWVGMGTGLFFAFAYWRYGLSAEFATVVFYFCVFLTIGLIDPKHKIIPNRIVYPASAVALAVGISIFFTRGSPAFVLTPEMALPAEIISAPIGGAAGFAILLVPALASQGGMGFGDVKMAMLIGLATGFPLVIVALLMGIVLGGLTAIFLLKTRRAEFHVLCTWVNVSPFKRSL